VARREGDRADTGMCADHQHLDIREINARIDSNPVDQGSCDPPNMQLCLRVCTGGCPVLKLHVLVAPRPRAELAHGDVATSPGRYGGNLMVLVSHAGGDPPTRHKSSDTPRKPLD
jgi:hypothetical protein